jgi:hypothetical protein
MAFWVRPPCGVVSWRDAALPITVDDMARSLWIVRSYEDLKLEAEGVDTSV